MVGYIRYTTSASQAVGQTTLSPDIRLHESTNQVNWLSTQHSVATDVVVAAVAAAVVGWFQNQTTLQQFRGRTKNECCLLVTQNAITGFGNRDQIFSFFDRIITIFIVGDSFFHHPPHVRCDGEFARIRVLELASTRLATWHACRYRGMVASSSNTCTYPFAFLRRRTPTFVFVHRARWWPVWES